MALLRSKRVRKRETIYPPRGIDDTRDNGMAESIISRPSGNSHPR